MLAPHDPASPLREPGRAGGTLYIREQHLAAREQQLAAYGKSLAESSAASDERHATERRRQDALQLELQAWQTRLEAAQQELEARQQANADWEASLRSREAALFTAAAAGHSGEWQQQRGGLSPITEGDRPHDEGQAEGAVGQAGTEAVVGVEDDGVEYDGEEGGGEEGGGEEGYGEEGYGDGDEWQAVTDEDSGRVYYWNQESGEVSWDPPGSEEADEEEVEYQPEAVDEEEAAEDIEWPAESHRRVQPVVPKLDLGRRHQQRRQQQQQPSPPLTLEGAAVAATDSGPPTVGAFPSPQRRVVIVDPQEPSSSSSLAIASSRHRLQGLRHRGRAEPPPPAHATHDGTHEGSPRPSWTKPEPKWARESAKLRESLAAARGGGGAVGPAQDDTNDGRVECPHCKRRFSEGAAERHIPKCTALKTKPRVQGRESTVSPRR